MIEDQYVMGSMRSMVVCLLLVDRRCFSVGSVMLKAGLVLVLEI